MKIFTKTNLAAAAVLSLGFLAAPAMACQWGNACTADYTAGGGGFTHGGYEAVGGGENWTTGGNIVERGSFSDSAGGFQGNFSFNANTCNGECTDNFAQAGGMGFAAQTSGSYIITDGANAYSKAAGEGLGLGESGAYSWRNPGN